MTSPSLPDQGLTYEQALAMVAAASAAATPAAAAQAITAAMSSSVAAARDTALQWASNLILGLWRDVNVYDGSAVQLFAEAAGGYMAEAQSVVAATAAAAQVQILSTMGIDDVPFDIADPVDVRGTPVVDEDGSVTVNHDTSTVDYTDGGRQVIDLDEDASTVGIFNRPARTQRYLESQGVGSEDARAQAEQRMLTLVDGNLMLAQRLAEAEILARAASVDERVIGLRRVIHPEMSRTGTCGLCIAASDRIYSVRELIPLHARCQCTVAAVTEEFDPADVLNAVDLSMLYENAGDTTSGAALKATRYKVNQHGELGPVLVPAKRRKAGKRTSAVPLASPARESPADIAARHLPQLEMSLAGLRSRGFSEESAQITYHRQQIERFRTDLNEPGTTGMPPTSPPPPPSTGGGGGPTDGGDDHPELSPEDRAAARAAAESKRALAAAAEPAVSEAVTSAVNATGGSLERFDSRLKSTDSLYRKIQDMMVEVDADADMAAGWVRDSLRYTAVVDEQGYWAAGDRIGDALVSAGYARRKAVLGWATEGYRGRNDTFVGADGLEFEVQIHTAASLRAAEETHVLYEVERLPTTSDEEKAQLRARQFEIFASVPVPDDIRWIQLPL